MANYNVSFSVDELIVDKSFVGPVSVPIDFVGIHNNSIGNNVWPVTRNAATNVSIDSSGLLSVDIIDSGAGYGNGNSTQFWVAAVFSGGDFTNKQAIGYPVISNNSVTGIIVTEHGDYKSIPPTCNIITTGGPNIPVVPSHVSSIRTHDYIGSGSATFPRTGRNDLIGANNYYTKWYGIDPGDGSGYNFSILDECVLYHAALGRKIMFTLYGTPKNYATTSAYTNLGYDNYYGGSAPLNSTGLTIGVPNVGLDGFVKSLVSRYNVNANLLTNPITGTPFNSSDKLLDSIEVWNEPIFGANGDALPAANGYYWIGSAQQLVDIIRIVNIAAKTLDPSIKIYGSGFVTGYPMTIGTGQYNHFSNFLTSVDSTESKSAHEWIDGITIHPYDTIEEGSSTFRYGDHFTQSLIKTIKRTLSTLSIEKPIIASEWGFFSTNSKFRSNIGTEHGNVMNSIQLKRIYCEHAIQGLKSTFGYSLESMYLGHPTRNIYGYNAIEETAKALNGKTIVEVKRGRIGDIMLSFSDGTNFYTR